MVFRHNGGSTCKSRKTKSRRKRNVTKNNNHCSPYSLKNKIVSGTCFTKEAIQAMTDAHNKENPSSSISRNLSPKEKWLRLRERMSHCDQDNACWLRSLPSKDKQFLQDQLFVPPKPTEWEKNPNSWLTNFDIAKVLNQYELAHPEFIFIGPSPIDYDTRKNKTECVCNRLCNFSVSKQLKLGKKKIGIVFNLDPHDKGGSHWVAMFIDLKDKFLFYFNSTGEEIQPQLLKFKDMVISQGIRDLGKMDYYVNTFEHQRSNTECGMYCLYFIITCLLREPDIFNTKKDKQNFNTQELVAYFTDKRIPDALVEGYRQELFY